jgi:hypothetical protein
LTKLLGRPIAHRKLSPEAFQAYWTGTGMPPKYAQIMVALDRAVEGGSEEGWTKQNTMGIDEWQGQKDIRVLKGNHKFGDFLIENLSKW